MGNSASLAIGKVLAHCGGSPAEAVKYLAGAIAQAPGDAEPYAALAELRRTAPEEVAAVLRDGGSVALAAAYAYVAFLDGDMDEAAMAIGTAVGVRPDIAWADAPWFSEPSFLAAVSPAAFGEAALRTMDGGHDLDNDETRTRLRPWFRAIDVLTDRVQDPDALARAAMLLRECGRIDAALAVCDRAQPTTMMIEVVRAGIWRRLGNQSEAAAAFQRAVELEPDNWSLYLDLADTRAQLGDFAAAVDATDQGLRHEPAELSLLAARAAYRTRLRGSADDLAALIDVAPKVPNRHYLRSLVGIACAGPGLTADQISAAQRVIT